MNAKKTKKADVLSEAEDMHKMKLWKKMFSLLANNKDHRKGGHGKCMYHLAAYFFYRLETNQGINYKPTPLMTTLANEDTKKRGIKQNHFIAKHWEWIRNKL